MVHHATKGSSVSPFLLRAELLEYARHATEPPRWDLRVSGQDARFPFEIDVLVTGPCVLSPPWRESGDRSFAANFARPAEVGMYSVMVKVTNLDRRDVHACPDANRGCDRMRYASARTPVASSWIAFNGSLGTDSSFGLVLKARVQAADAAEVVPHKRCGFLRGSELFWRSPTQVADATCRFGALHRHPLPCPLHIGILDDSHGRLAMSALTNLLAGIPVLGFAKPPFLPWCLNNKAGPTTFDPTSTRKWGYWPADCNGRQCRVVFTAGGAAQEERGCCIRCNSVGHVTARVAEANVTVSYYPTRGLLQNNPEGWSQHWREHLPSLTCATHLTCFSLAWRSITT